MELTVDTIPVLLGEHGGDTLPTWGGGVLATLTGGPQSRAVLQSHLATLWGCAAAFRRPGARGISLGPALLQEAEKLGGWLGIGQAVQPPLSRSLPPSRPG